MRIDGIELFLATRERRRNRRDMEIQAGDLKGGGFGVMRREDTGTEGSESQRLLYYDPLVGRGEMLFRRRAFGGLDWGGGGGEFALFAWCPRFSGRDVVDGIVLRKSAVI